MHAVRSLQLAAVRKYHQPSISAGSLIVHSSPGGSGSGRSSSSSSSSERSGGGGLRTPAVRHGAGGHAMLVAYHMGHSHSSHGHSHGAAPLSAKDVFPTVVSNNNTTQGDPAIVREGVWLTQLGALSNVGLAAAKAVVGYMSGSSAMLADALHSLSDLLSDVVTLGAIKIGRAPASEKHPYGHGKFEPLGALAVSGLLVIGAGGMAFHSFHSLQAVLEGHGQPLQFVEIAVGMSVASIVVKELLFRWTHRVGIQLRSPLLVANAWHHRSDSLSSFVTVGGIAGSMMGLPWLDAVAGMGVAALIGHAGVQTALESIRNLSDQSDEDMTAAAANVIRHVPGVRAFHRLRCRRMGPYVLLDVDIEVDRSLSVSASQAIRKNVHDAIISQVENVAEAIVAVHTELDMTLPRPLLEIQAEAIRAAQGVRGVKHVEHVREHVWDNRVIIQMEIVVDESLRISDAAKIAERVRDAVEQVPDVSEADIHLEVAHLQAKRLIK